MSGVQIFFLSVFIVWMAVSLFLTIKWCINVGLTAFCMPSEVYDYYVRDAILKEDKIVSMPDENKLKAYRFASKFAFVLMIIINPIYVLLHSIWFIFNHNIPIEGYKWICYDNGYGGLVIVPVKSVYIETFIGEEMYYCDHADNVAYKLKYKPCNRFVELMKKINEEDKNDIVQGQYMPKDNN